MADVYYKNNNQVHIVLLRFDVNDSLTLLTYFWKENIYQLSHRTTENTSKY